MLKKKKERAFSGKNPDKKTAEKVSVTEIKAVYKTQENITVIAENTFLKTQENITRCRALRLSRPGREDGGRITPAAVPTKTLQLFLIIPLYFPIARPPVSLR